MREQLIVDEEAVQYEHHDADGDGEVKSGSVGHVGLVHVIVRRIAVDAVPAQYTQHMPHKSHTMDEPTYKPAPSLQPDGVRL